MRTGKRENRKSVRRPTRRAAEVAIAGMEQLIPCVIFDISNGGARLAIGRSAKDLPDRFTLVLYKNGSAQRDCEVVWFDYKHAGVKFVSDWYAADVWGNERQTPLELQNDGSVGQDRELAIVVPKPEVNY